MLDEIIKIQQKSQNLYTIIFQSGRTLDVSEDVLIEYQLLKGTQMTEAFIDKVTAAEAENKVYQLALHYLSFKMRTVQEVEDYLTKKEINLELINPVIAKLSRQKYLDDNLYAKQYIQMHMRLQDKGPVKLKRDLLSKGVAEQIIDANLEVFDVTEQQNNALKLAQKAQKKYSTKTAKEAKQKIYQKLINQGYSTSVAKEVIAELDFEEDFEQQWEQIIKLGEKLQKRYRKDDLYKKKEKIKAYLYQKGYSYDLITEYVQEYLLE